ncbi:FmdB family zinc ribbon protein [Balneatrix alpica]|uniref:FmdB family zinc ribbon protein n=1 Tax=Balneatrix alpica TaxID=75684 RepID=A0ABV5Z6R2_9GAMM|nr:zinc ribbon domain-containing protein [Balneatrix alpica]
MPIYEYLCSACGHELEAIQKFSDDPLTECPSCAEPQLVKQLSLPGFRLSGSGWYETDFKTGSKKNLADNKGESCSANPANCGACSAGAD